MAITKSKRLEQLEQECKERGVRIIYDDLRSEGGLCRLRGSFFLILNRRLAPETRARAIADALARLRDMTDKGHDRNLPGISDRVPISANPESAVQVSPVETAPAVANYPAPEFEETEVGVPVTSGVPDSQS